MTKPFRNLVVASPRRRSLAGVTRARAQTVETATVSSRETERVVALPAELAPYQAVALSARVSAALSNGWMSIAERS